MESGADIDIHFFGRILAYGGVGGCPGCCWMLLVVLDVAGVEGFVGFVLVSVLFKNFIGCAARAFGAPSSGAF